MSEFRVIVTGGAGFIGSQVVRELNRRGADDILVVDHLGTSDKWRNLVGLRFADYLEKDDLLRRIGDGSLDPPQAVFHLGACSATTERDASYLAANNFAYTRDLCAWCLEHGTRFVYASSAATYGDGSQGYSDADEVTPTLRPLNMYGYSKHMFDLWALRRDAFKLIAGLKYFNVYGPGEAHKGDMRSVVHKAWGQIRERGYVELFRSHREAYEDGGQVRDFIYVKDAVDVTLWLGERREVSGLFNCGTGEARSWNDLAAAVFRALGRDPDIRYIEMPEALRGKYQYHTQADPRKLRAAGYDRAFTSLEDGVADYVVGHLEADGDPRG